MVGTLRVNWQPCICCIWCMVTYLHLSIDIRSPPPLLPIPCRTAQISWMEQICCMVTFLTFWWAVPYQHSLCSLHFTAFYCVDQFPLWLNFIVWASLLCDSNSLHDDLFVPIGLFPSSIISLHCSYRVGSLAVCRFKFAESLRKV